MEATHATALGLILNELLTNTIKHAFANGRPGHVQIAVRRENNEVVIEIFDDGPGFDPGAVQGKTLGRKLIERLSHQLDGTTKWTSSGEGTTSITRIQSDPIS